MVSGLFGCKAIQFCIKLDIMDNTTENKQRFFAQYWGQQVFGGPYLQGSWHYTGENFDGIDESVWMNLKPLSSITDEELIHVARLAHERPKHDFKVTRNKDIFYAQTDYDSIGINYFISMLPAYASVCATMNFQKFKDEGFKSHTVNIGKVNLSADRPIAYIAIVDYLRSKGYALPFMGLTVKDQIKYGWIRITD